MKVILKREVDNLGLPGDVVDVKDGYGRNFLLPRGYAILATRGAMKEAEALTRSRKAAEAKTLGSAEAAREVLEARALRIPVRVDERGHLYGSVSASDIHRVLKERGHDIERKRIELKGTIKEIGIYEVPVRVHPQVSATVEVEVVDVEGVVTLEGPPPEPEPLPEPEAAPSVVDQLAEEALAAAEELEAEEEREAEGEREAAEEREAEDTEREERSDSAAEAAMADDAAEER
jgi:large subunit ribosomal protein L9